ncbi:hypothetical protein [Bradyrhizobium sp. CCBAU 53421]|uniref:hypothetical protein n=1 Tax=Bradyrhizobium sp. CCBAU 53421 TaxID=1325120 RepID=UPI00188C5D39|nr:hypothetical protein [Bradyrhizobium sp. CCBAU 53421]QOZ31655.1 hypothetical protein XH92_07935 [Bradyrhizobium sp. CCBAU 53421]
MGGALAHQSLAFPMRAARVLFLDARHLDDGADMLVAAIQRDQGTHQHRHVDPVRLDARARRLTWRLAGSSTTAVEAFTRQRPRQQKAIIARLVAEPAAAARNLMTRPAKEPPAIR